MMDPQHWQEKRVLVTGGAGFLGRWTVRELQSRGALPTVLDRAGGTVAVDMLDSAGLNAALRAGEYHAVIHLAGQAGVRDSHQDPAGAFAANTTATFNLMEAARDLPSLESVVHVSSNHVYGPQARMPTPESAPLNGEGMYAATKTCADVIARCYGKSYGLPVGIARITNTFGGDDPHHSHIVTGTILSLLKGEPPVIRSSGRDSKGYLYVEDTVRGILAVAAGAAPGEAYNIVPDAPVTTRELVDLIVGIFCACTDVLVMNPPATFEVEYLDNSRAKRELGWRPDYDLAAGLAKTIQWYRAHYP
jgi:CDP-glucose 4,6-dehydratase